MHFTESNYGYVYFVQSEKGGPIKIGTASNVYRRLNQLQTGNPEKLVLLHSTTGGKRFEYRLHDKFSNYNILNEWFSPDEVILNYIRKVRVEDSKYGIIKCLKSFIEDLKHNVDGDELEVLISLLNGAILPNSSFTTEQKYKYWVVIDDYLGYLKKFPRWLIHERFFNCFLNEGRQDADRIIRRENNIILNNF